MAAPIRSQAEIDTIINRGNHTIADLGLEIIGDAKNGAQLSGGQQSDVDYRAKVYRLVLLRAYLKNIIDPITAETKLYYTASANEKKYNALLTAIAELSNTFSGPGIPLIRGRRLPLYFYPSSSGVSSGGASNSGGPATPGGVTFQNLSVDAPGEVVDQLEASGSEYAFYIINARGTNSGEGSRLDIIGVNWRDGNTPTMTNYFGSGNGGTTDISYSAAIVDGQMQLTCNVSTDNWAIKGTRISFENIAFENVLGPLPIGGTLGQYLRKISSTDFEAEWANISMSEITGLATALTNLATDIATAQADINAHISDNNNPHSVTKSQVGLGNADNTSDVNKPVSSAQQIAIDAKVEDAIVNGVTTKAPSQNAVYDADALLQAQIDALAGGGLVTVSGTSYTILAANKGKIHNFDNSAVRTGTLPLANTVSAGVPFWIKDSAYNAGTNSITMGLTGGDTFEDAGTSVEMGIDGIMIGFYSDGISKWYLM